MSKLNIVWYANYNFRMREIAKKELLSLENVGVIPKFTEREVKRYTLKQYIKFIGHKTASELFGISEASIRAWRYGYRQPSIEQAKKIIQATGGRLDFESIYGELKEIIKGADVSTESNGRRETT